MFADNIGLLIYYLFIILLFQIYFQYVLLPIVYVHCIEFDHLLYKIIYLFYYDIYIYIFMLIYFIVLSMQTCMNKFVSMY